MDEKFSQPDWNFFQNFLQQQQNFLQNLQKNWDPETLAKGVKGFESDSNYQEFWEKNKDSWFNFLNTANAQPAAFGNLFAQNPSAPFATMHNPLHYFFQFFLFSQKFLSNLDHSALKDVMAQWQKMQGEISQLFLSSLPTKIPLPNGENLDFSIAKEWSKFYQHSVEPFENWLKAQPDVYEQVIQGKYGVLLEPYKQWWQMVHGAIKHRTAFSKLGIAREYSEKWDENLMLWGEYSEALIAYQLVLCECGHNAMEELIKMLAEKTDQSAGFSSMQDLQKTSVAIFERHFDELLRSPVYNKKQALQLHGFLRWKKSWDGLMQEQLKNSPIATKQDLDQTNEVLFRLKRELQATKKEVAKLQKQLQTTKHVAPAKRQPNRK